MKTLAQINRRIEQLRVKVARLEPVALSSMETPGSFVTGRSGRVSSDHGEKWLFAEVFVLPTEEVPIAAD